MTMNVVLIGVLIALVVLYVQRRKSHLGDLDEY